MELPARDGRERAGGVGAPGAAPGVPAARASSSRCWTPGVAYANRGRFRRSPDFSKSRFVRGWDFVEDDAYPNDDNGHGTHVASTIAEGTGNTIGLTGLAYGVKVMPVKVLDSQGEGDSAADRRRHPLRRRERCAGDQPLVRVPVGDHPLADPEHPGRDPLRPPPGHAGRRRLRQRRRRGVAYPARSSDVLSVGATTQSGCQADYSNEGSDLDLVAPGGGVDAALEGDPNCQATRAGMDIFQMTFRRTSPRRFLLPSGYIGTSMAAPHAAATAALVIASGVLGPKPSPAAIERRLELTSTDLGPAGRDPHYGWGRLNAARATDPTVPVT